MKQVKIFHTNDIHGKYEKFNSISALIRNKISQCRKNRIPYLVVDAGDFFDFTRIDLLGTGGTEAVKLLEQANYDALAIGNNEAFQGSESLYSLLLSTNFPILSANLNFRDNSSKEILHPDKILKYIIIERFDFKFVVIGLTPEYNEFFHLDGLHAEPAMESVNTVLKKIKEKYDQCIILSHLGLEEDKKLAEKLDNCIIIGGHSHSLTDPLLLNSNIIHHSGCHADHLGLLEFETNGNKIIGYSGINFENDRELKDETILSIIDRSYSEAKKNLGAPFCKIKTDLFHDLLTENPLSNFMADSLKDMLNADIGIVNAGLFQSGIFKGEISKMDLINICPSPLNPTLIKIKGKYILQAFGDSCKNDLCLADGKGSGFRGHYVGKLHISGGEVIYQIRENYESEIKDIFIEGKKIDPEKTYTAATTDYLQRGSGYGALGNCELVSYSPEFIKKVFEIYLPRNDFIDNAQIKRWIKNK